MSDGKITIYDLAEAAGVSIATVNRALYNKPRVSEETRERITALAEEMGYTANRAAQALSRNPITIGVLLTRSIPEVSEEALKGINNAMDSLKYLNVKSKVVTVERGSDVSGSDVSAYKRLVSAGCKGIVILSGSKLDGLRQAISAAKNEGVLTATLITDIPESERVLSVRSNGFCAGEMAAEEFSKLCPNKTVAVFASSKEVPICTETLSGFLSGCKRFGITPGHVFENYDDPDTAEKAIDKLKDEYPETRGIYICSANSQSACERLCELGISDRYKIVATDLFSSISRNIISGVISSTIFQHIKEQGEIAVKTLYRMLTGEEPANAREILLVPELVMRSNIEPVIKREENK